MEYIVGYPQPMVVSPGDEVEIKVSCPTPTYSSQLMRLGVGVKDPSGPDIGHVSIPSYTDGVHEGRKQWTRPGSYARIDDFPALARTSDDLQFSFNFCATLLTKLRSNEFSALFSTRLNNDSQGITCGLGQDGRMIVYHSGMASPCRVETDIFIERNRWYSVKLEVVNSSQHIQLYVGTCTRDAGPSWSRSWSTSLNNTRMSFDHPLIIGADQDQGLPTDTPAMNNCFNGKLDGFTISSVPDRQDLLRIDFSREMDKDNISCAAGSGSNIVLVNGPKRATTGHDWDKNCTDWTRSRGGFGGIWFCEDDANDVRWHTDFVVKLPASLQSGPYSILVRDGMRLTEDHVVFFVRPVAKRRIGFVLSTFTYLAYGNEQIFDPSRKAHIDWPTDQYDPYAHVVTRRSDLGLSLYDTHRDGSGVVYSSVKRPLLNMRPNYVHWGTKAPRGLSADLFLLQFLSNELGRDQFDVLTDHDISDKPSIVLEYDVLVSSTHPEYATLEMLDCLEGFIRRGGRMMYLGGNGYYWVTAHNQMQKHMIEVRRAQSGCRSFELNPEDRVHSLTGEQGGLWRDRGKPPTDIFGVGSVACSFKPGIPYVLDPTVRFDSNVIHLFAGIPACERLIGQTGLFARPASGDEIDCMQDDPTDLRGGHRIMRLATTRCDDQHHSDDYRQFPEETMFPMEKIKGSESTRVRSDIVLAWNGRGIVFAVGSMDWLHSRTHHECPTIVPQWSGSALR